ncbi:MAG: hypothetical protein R3C14_15585 [Caldilineaceae bacterium]
MIEHAVIRYGGYFAASSEEYYKCYYCKYYVAVWLFSASPTIRNSTLFKNDHGIAAWDGSMPTLNCNEIYANLAEGIYSDKLEIPVNAENQWWGDATGPIHTSNPNGQGQAVGDGVDFTP